MITGIIDNSPRIASGKIVTVAVIRRIIVDSESPGYCSTGNWDSERCSDRCPGLSTICDSGDLFCERFIGSFATQKHSTMEEVTLRNDDSTIALWGKGKPVRCDACITGEAVLRK